MSSQYPGVTAKIARSLEARRLPTRLKSLWRERRFRPCVIVWRRNDFLLVVHLTNAAWRLVKVGKPIPFAAVTHTRGCGAKWSALRWKVTFVTSDNCLLFCRFIFINHSRYLSHVSTFCCSSETIKQNVLHILFTIQSTFLGSIQQQLVSLSSLRPILK